MSGVHFHDRHHYDCHHILERLGALKSKDAVSPYWETALATLPTTQAVLRESCIRDAAAFCQLDDDAVEACCEAARRIEADAALKTLLWHCHRLLAEHVVPKTFEDWPDMKPALGDLAGAFYLLAALGMVPRIRAMHQQRGWPERVSRETCLVIPAFVQNHRGFCGGVGILKKQLHWIRHHHAGRLVRLGRMEWMRNEFNGAAHVYRHKTSGQTVALSQGGRLIGPAGQACWMDDPIPQGAWTTAFARDESSVRGHVISPRGRVLRRQMTLPLDEWDHRLSPGMPVLDLHIPAGGGMTLAACGDSMRQALSFFDTHMKDWPYRAFSCISWILNTQLQDILAQQANLVQFQRQLYLLPVSTPPTDGFFFIFGRDHGPLDKLPRETSLQRRILHYLEQGHRWRGGAMFYLPEDIDAFGSEPYLSQTDRNEIEQRSHRV